MSFFITQEFQKGANLKKICNFGKQQHFLKGVCTAFLNNILLKATTCAQA